MKEIWAEMGYRGLFAGTHQQASIVTSIVQAIVKADFNFFAFLILD